MGSAQCFFFFLEKIWLFWDKEEGKFLEICILFVARNSTNFSNFVCVKFCQFFHMKKMK
jgi:hypothetical protein